jgi:hypothetical protein
VSDSIIASLMDPGDSVHNGSAAPAVPSRRTQHRVAALERRTPHLLSQAHEAGVEIEYLGVMPLFVGSRAYGAPETDWVVSPVGTLDRDVIPAAQLQVLRRLTDAGIDFPLTYVAHEVPKDRLGLPPGSASVSVPEHVARDLAGEVPPPAEAIELGRRLGRSSERVLQMLRRALPVAGAIVAAPVLLAGAALGGALSGLDPIVFGVEPAGTGVEGEPAAWYMLVKWDW